jgi:Predicted membrane protein
MKGTVLAHEVISAQDGHRYSFTQEDVKSQDKIQIGDEVDFVANNLKANEIYVISKILNTEISSIRTLALVGACLSIFGFIGGVLYIPGFICLLIAILKLANLVNSPTLKRNYILSAICGVIGVVLILIGAFLGMSSSIGATSNNGFTFSPTVIILLALGVIISIYSLYKMFLTYKELSQISGDKFFLYYAILSIIGIATMMVLVGYVLLIVATILHIIAWYRFKI